ncbi:hypothetical protein F511_21264 [Dorcoceras hygrometricum]|uniref:Uncharacterized protein n=1 Tax=Dorcoceras hygrometricum TaxID=472368 RepID=A0A2Z7D7X6_9LAMI|nr:hypothetical protein F511_21264 [Dorcoceras hygrometricum]
MADQTDEDEVFDFANVEFTRDDLVIALNDMVKEYRKLSHSFEEAKAENVSLKSSSAESSSDEQEDADILKTELSKLQAENELLRNEISELMAEVAKSTVEMSSYNKANITLQKLCENQKQAGDKTGIGFSNSEFCEGESSTQSRPAYDKFNKMSFVKADMIYNCLESVTYDNQNSPKLNENGKAGIGFSKPESSKPDWLKNRLDKDKAKASQKPFVPNQSRHNSKKVKSSWKKFQQRRDQYDHHVNPKLKRPARDFAHSFVDPRSGKTPDLDALLALKAKEKLMLEWAETDSLETAVKRRLFILSRYRELLLRTLLDSHRHYLVSVQPWTANASQTFDLLSAVHSESLDALRNQQQEHGILLEQPCSSTAVDYAEDCGIVFARFFSVARSTCWVRPLICVDGIWTPLQGPDLWRSGCRLSLFLNKVEMPAPAVQDIFGHSVSLIEPTQYWVAAQFLPKTWAWHCVCTEVFPFSISGRLRPASCSTDIVMYSLDVQKLPAYLLDDFQRGIHTDCFAGYFGSSVALSDSETHSDSSSGCTVYRSPSPVDNPFALGPAISSRVDQVEQPYFVQSPVSPPAAFSHQESSSSSDVSIHFDSEDLPMRAPEAAHTSAPVDSHVSSAALEDLRSYFSKRIDESTTELRSKVNEVEFNVRGDLFKQQAWLRQMFHNGCDILERQSTQINDLKKGLVAPVGTIFQDLFDIKKNDRAHEAKLNALDGQVAALLNDQLEFQNRISADLLSLSTQFADIVEFIRGGDAKKGESGSSSRPPPVRVERRPLPTPQSPRDVAGGSSAVRIPTFPRTTGTIAERVEQARRHLLESGLFISVEEAAERIRQADIQESDRLQRERERARREKRSSSSRRRRGF